MYFKIFFFKKYYRSKAVEASSFWTHTLIALHLDVVQCTAFCARDTTNLLGKKKQIYIYNKYI